MKKRTIDKPFLGIVIVLIVFGLFIFVSASLSVLANNETQFYRILMNQLVLGFAGGMVALVITSRVSYTKYKKHALYIFIAALIATALVFIPGLGLEHGGAKRWLLLGPISFQPGELLKFGFVIYFAAWLSWVKRKVATTRYGLVPFLVLLALSGGLLLLQPDTGTLLVIIIAGICMYFIAGARWRDLGVLLVVGIIGFSLLVATRPYILERIKTFSNPSHDPQGSSYQVRQSLIAIGSGKITGRGYGQSVQKFNYLPEPTSDSVFAVVGEEFGFLGSVVLVLLFIAFAIRGLYVARRAPNVFSRLLVIGIVILIVSQSLMNIGAAIGVLPLTGVPLIFVSQGGTALLFSLLGVGIILNVSKHMKKHSL